MNASVSRSSSSSSLFASASETPKATSKAAEKAPARDVYEGAVEKAPRRDREGFKPGAEGAFNTHKTLFWETLQAGRADVLALQLKSLRPEQRFLLANTPKASEEFEPKLPLCIAAAHGSIPLMTALLQPSGAQPLAGEKCDDLVLTALYWAARYGVGESMDFLYDNYGIDSSQAMLACDESATEGLVKWLARHDVAGSALDRAMQQAVERDDLDSIVNLHKFGRARVDIAASEDANGRSTLLTWAINNGKLAAASALIDAGADADGGRAEHDKQPLWLALTKHETGLVRRLLASKASGGMEHLKHALAQGTSSSALYVALYDNGVLPETSAQAKDLQRLAVSNGDFELIGLITAQKTMLERQELRGSEEKALRKDSAYNFAKTQVAELAEALRNAPTTNMAMPEGVAMLTDIKLPTAKSRGLRGSRTVNAIKNFKVGRNKADATGNEQAIEVAARRYGR